MPTREPKYPGDSSRFPLADWVDSHAGVPHDLGASGMRGAIPPFDRRFRRRETDHDGELRGRLAALHGVDPARLFLAHGASEGNALALSYLRQRLGRGGLRPTASVRLPEYPPLWEAVDFLGYRRSAEVDRPDLSVLSSPQNPTGVRAPPEELSYRARQSRALLVDETFREFTPARSVQTYGLPKLWTTGTFTKAYGADAVRVGWVIAPEEERTAFARFHGVMTDEIPPHSIGAALGLLDHRTEVLGRVRRMFGRNRSILRRRIPGVPSLAGPVWFDRGEHGLPGDSVAEAALAHGVLVSSGSFFGDPSGVRLGLTRPTFARHLGAYLPIRAEWVERGRSPPRYRR